MTANLAQIETTRIYDSFGILTRKVTLCDRSVIEQRYADDRGVPVRAYRSYERLHPTAVEAEADYVARGGV